MAENRWEGERQNAAREALRINLPPDDRWEREAPKTVDIPKPLEALTISPTTRTLQEQIVLAAAQRYQDSYGPPFDRWLGQERIAHARQALFRELTVLKGMTEEA